VRKYLVSLVVVAPLLVGWLVLDPSGSSERVAIQGLWDRVAPSSGPEVQFYYFHTNDLGLFRFGSTALNHTQMFRRRWRRGRLEIVFSKTGARHVTDVALERDDRGRRILVLASDPRNGGRPARYRRRTDRGPRLRAGADRPEDPLARMWMHQRVLARGARDFRIYQFRPADDDGAGTGWFHVGDYDEWTTEALGFHRAPGRILLRFTARGDAAVTPMRIEASEGGRALHLAQDPRYFGRGLTYDDVGPNVMADPVLQLLKVSTGTF